MKIILVSILLVMMIFCMAKTLFVSDAKELDLILRVRILVIELMFVEKISTGEGNQLLDCLTYENLLKPGWCMFISPFVWSVKSRFKKGMYKVLMAHYENLQSL